jgi:hypothetical protein
MRKIKGGNLFMPGQLSNPVGGHARADRVIDPPQSGYFAAKMMRALGVIHIEQQARV